MLAMMICLWAGVSILQYLLRLSPNPKENAKTLKVILCPRTLVSEVQKSENLLYSYENIIILIKSPVQCPLAQSGSACLPIKLFEELFNFYFIAIQWVFGFSDFWDFWDFRTFGWKGSQTLYYFWNVGHSDNLFQIQTSDMQ